MNKLKERVLKPLAWLVGVLALLYIYLLLGQEIGYLLALFMETVAIGAGMFKFSEKLKEKIGEKAIKVIVTILGSIWGVIIIATSGAWLGSKIGFLWAFFIEFVVIATVASILRPTQLKQYLKERAHIGIIVVGVVVSIVASVWLGTKIGFFLTAFLMSLVATLILSVIEKKLDEQQMKKATIGALTTLACVWILAVGVWVYKIPPAEPMGPNNDVWVQVQAQEVLKDYLKSPSTAKFPSTSNVTIERYKDNFFKVSSFVDAQNSFGASSRSTWYVTFQVVDKTIAPYVVVLDGEALLKRDLPK